MSTGKRRKKSVFVDNAETKPATVSPDDIHLSSEALATLRRQFHHEGPTRKTVKRWCRANFPKDDRPTVAACLSSLWAYGYYLDVLSVAMDSARAADRLEKKMTRAEKRLAKQRRETKHG